MKHGESLRVGDKTFTSRTAAFAAYSRILNKYEPGERVNPEHQPELEELFLMHPKSTQKLDGRDMADFKVDYRDFGSKCFYVVRSDGEAVHFSIKRALGLK